MDGCSAAGKSAPESSSSGHTCRWAATFRAKGTDWLTALRVSWRLVVPDFYAFVKGDSGFADETLGNVSPLVTLKSPATA